MPIVRLLEARIHGPRRYWCQIHIGCLIEAEVDVPDGVELFFTYVSARSSIYLGGILTQPLTTGANTVELVINPPDLEMIPEDTMMDAALLIMRARYQGAFFMIAPFYVYYEYDHYLLRRFPPTRGVFVLRIHRYVYLLLWHIAYIS